MKVTLAIVVAWLTLITSVPARDLYVDNVRGLETNDGLADESGPNNRGPFKTIHRGLRTAEPGDTVHLIKNEMRDYTESAVFHNRECPADKPIKLDGHDSIICGVDRVDLAAWELVEPGLYRKTNLLKQVDSAIVGRYFFRFNDTMQHMGRTSKGPSAKLKEPKDLQPGEWTFTANGDGTPKSPYVDATFYVKIDPAKKPSDYKIEYPARSSGVQVSGRCENIVIRNLNVRHVYNDGFNIHGYSRNVLFEKCSATECGDDGISAHDDCRITVRKFHSIGNSTGFCHTNESWSDSDDVFIKDCLGFDVFVLGSGTHRLTNSIVKSSASSSVVVLGSNDADKPGPCRLQMELVLVERSGKNERLKFQPNSIVELKRCVFSGFHVDALGNSLEMIATSIDEGSGGAEDRPAKQTRYFTLGPETKFVGKDNLYDLKHIRRGDKIITRETYGAEAAKLGDVDGDWVAPGTNLVRYTLEQGKKTPAEPNR